VKTESGNCVDEYGYDWMGNVIRHKRTIKRLDGKNTFKGEAFESILDIWANITEVNGILFNLNGHPNPFRQVDISIIYAPVTEVLFAFFRCGLRPQRGQSVRVR